ncbi:carboxylating nicotinate-nucleotide diphosphorylase [Clostridium ihumii]|uniref:carboxylating nicotinate-nucleotide diphosphorylase n=1 Tax=Clostridium ihumii TaxID=1470356 RepID=UPI0005517112|nr:carboxylating nicotinate-nucleotide diphosphorylase [Clostridium ihumii]
MNWFAVDDFLINSLKEDMPYYDLTTDSIVNDDSLCSIELICKEDGIIAGLPVFKRVFELLGNVDISFNFKDGDIIKKGDIIANLKGNTKNILSGERLALNIIQRMSGIATLTNNLVKEISHTKAKLLDTRKTTPGLRMFEKYAVKIGGGVNHRYSLSDGILIKDNHIKAAGNITNAVTLVRNNIGNLKKIEVETESIEEVKEAILTNADIIMLDNMSIETMNDAVKVIDGAALTEASGNIDLSTIKSVAETGVDFISSGATTHSYKSLDISLKNLKYI